MERLRQPVLAGRVPHRRQRPDPARVHRRRRLSLRGTADPGPAQRRAPGIARPGATDVPDTAPVDQNQTPETYLGAERQQFYAGGGSYATGRFTPPAKLPANSFALAGAWTIGQEAITAGQGAGITLAFHASDVYLDVGGTGMLTVSAGGASKVIQVSGAPDIYTVATGQPAQDGTGTIRLSAGLAAYSFTFG